MRIVIKVGTSTLTHKTGKINIRRIEKMCKVLSDLKNKGDEIILVSSGAIGMGIGKLGLKEKPIDTPTNQAAAAVGQCELMYVYDKLFSEYNHTIAQLLITGSDIESKEKYNNFRNTIYRLLDMGVLPIINENDTVSTDEIVIGDNDTLAAIVTVSIEADLLILLSDINGFYTSDPRKDPKAKMLKTVEKITPEIILCGKDKGTKFGTGGMKTKLNAAKMVTEKGIDMVIANGSRPEILYDIVSGEQIGTRFIGKRKKS